MKVLKEYKEPTTIVITGQWVDNVKSSLLITDDEFVIDIRKFNGDEVSLTTFGSITILTEEEFNWFVTSDHYIMHCDDDFGNEENMYVVIKDYVGVIGATANVRGGIDDFDKWNVDDYFYHQVEGELYVDVKGEYEFEAMTVGEVKEFLESDRGSKVTDILSEETKEDLYNQIENQGFGYWIQNYGYKGDEDGELVELCIKARRMMNKVQKRLNELGVEI